MSTDTFALLEVSQSTYNEIKDKLLTAGCSRAIKDGPLNPRNHYIDMRGLALVQESQTVKEARELNQPKA